MEIAHPLPIGTLIMVNIESFDEGIMSWDDTDTLIERRAPAGSMAVVWNIEEGEGGPIYDVEFVPSEVWNRLDPQDFSSRHDLYEVVELGTGVLPSLYTDYHDNPDRERDPDAVRKIEEARASAPAR